MSINHVLKFSAAQVYKTGPINTNIFEVLGLHIDSSRATFRPATSICGVLQM